MSNEWEYIVKLLGLSAGGWWMFISRYMRSVCKLGVGELSF